MISAEPSASMSPSGRRWCKIATLGMGSAARAGPIGLGAIENRAGTKREHRALVLYPVLSSPPSDCRPRLSTLAGPFSALLRRPYFWAMPSASFLPLRRTSALLRPIEIGPEPLAGQDRAKRERFRAALKVVQPTPAPDADDL